MGYPQESEETAPKVANILSGFESTTATTASSSTTAITSNTSHNEEKGQNPEPGEAAPHPAPVADSSPEPVEARPHPAPVADSSLAKLSVTSSQSGRSVDLLADGRSECSESVWDYDERPLTHVSLKRSLDDSRQENRDAAWAAPPTAANAPISQDLSDMPMPFQKMRRPKCPPAVRQVASEFICHKCSREINWCPLRRKNLYVFVDVFCFGAMFYLNNVGRGRNSAKICKRRQNFYDAGVASM